MASPYIYMEILKKENQNCRNVKTVISDAVAR